MKNLLLSSFLLLVLSSCNFGHYGRLKEPPTGYTPVAFVPKPIFGDNFNSFLFKTNLTVYGRDFSGLLVTKQMSPKDYRVIFTTELGMKLFDFEFKDTAFTLHYCVPQFNKPKLLKVIQKDIEVLLMNDISTKKFNFLFQPKDSSYVYRSNEQHLQNYYFVDGNSAVLEKIEQAKKRRKKTTFTLSNYENGFPGNIVIQHHDIKLKIELNHLKK